ncbi:hypothetical protein [Brevifollis gellanilyticus]|nr:hypothetical protein [Brevifollis gellanilyticus]
MPDELFSSSPGNPDSTYMVEDLASDDSAPRTEAGDEGTPTMPMDDDTLSQGSETRAAGTPSTALAAKDLGESGLEQFFETSFTTPEATKAAVNSLIESFDDKGLWLSSLVQPAQLTSELRQGFADLTTLVLTQWVRQGETHKLKQLGDALLAEEPRQQTHESARIMAVVAGLLGILRPVLAQRLLVAAAPKMINAADTALMRDARQWVDAGGLLEGCVPEERVFWNRRLREPAGDWHWDTTEARMALGHLARKRPAEEVDLSLFQNTVPGCWWDLWRDPEAAAASVKAAPQPVKKSRGGFGLGLVLGVAATAALAWLGYTNLPEAKVKEVPVYVTQMVEKKVEVERPVTAAVSTAAVLVEEAEPAPPIRESLRKLQALLKRAPSPLSKARSVAVAEKPALLAVAAASPAARVAPAESGGLTKLEARKKAALEFASQHQDVARLVRLVKDGTFRENERLIQGGSSVAAMGSPAYKEMIQWLILDPPERADSRLVVTKMALRAIPAAEAIPLFDLCYYEGSPNQIEIKECSQLLLELPIQDMQADHKALLQAIVAQ